MSDPSPWWSSSRWTALLYRPVASDPVTTGIWVLVTAVLLAPMRAVFGDLTNTLWGCQLDTVYHAWGIWWSRLSDGHESTLVSFPTGEHGSLLAPFTAAVVQPLVAISGTALAFNMMNVLALMGSVVGLAVLARSLGIGRRSAALAALLFAGARPFVGQAALGTVEGAVLGPLFFACAAGVVWPRRSIGFGLLVGGLFAVSVLENPYTLVPGGLCAVVFAFRRWKASWGGGTRAWGSAGVDIGLAALLGAGMVWARLRMAGGDVGGNLPASWSATVFGTRIAVVDPETFPFHGLLTPALAPDLATSAAEISTSGWLLWPGWLVFAFALLARPFPWRLSLLALLGFGLSLGSVPLGTDSAIFGPFFWLNAVLERVAHPLTQPFRFLPMGVAATALIAGMGLDRLFASKRGRIWLGLSLAAITLEAGLLGAPTVKAGAISLEPSACWTPLRGAGPVHVVPLNGETPMGALPINSEAMLWQLVHEQPSTSSGIGGWTRAPQSAEWTFSTEVLQSHQNQWRRSNLWARALDHIADNGVTVIILNERVAREATAKPLAECHPWRAFAIADLQQTAPDQRGARSAD